MCYSRDCELLAPLLEERFVQQEVYSPVSPSSHRGLILPSGAQETYSLDVHPPSLPLSLRATVIQGAGRGKQMGVPTLNLTLSDVPAELQEGIYACFAVIDGQKLQGALHYGPRPVFDDSVACEIHLLDITLDQSPAVINVEVVKYLREVRNFPSVDALTAQIQQDIQETRAALDVA